MTWAVTLFANKCQLRYVFARVPAWEDMTMGVGRKQFGTSVKAQMEKKKKHTKNITHIFKVGHGGEGRAAICFKELPDSKA